MSTQVEYVFAIIIDEVFSVAIAFSITYRDVYKTQCGASGGLWLPRSRLSSEREGLGEQVVLCPSCWQDTAGS